MSTTIKVTGFKTPRLPKAHRRRRGVPLVAARNLIWVGILVAAGVTFAALGTPHLLMHYRWGGAPDAPFYMDCAYVGLGNRTISPPDGRCPLVRLLHDTGA